MTDAELIVALVNNAEALLNEVERLREENYNPRGKINVLEQQK